MTRDWSRILRAAFQPQHYLSFVTSHIYPDWNQFFVRRYIMGSGAFPFECRIRTPMGVVSVTLYSPEDCYTVQEIFGLQCYRADKQQIYVDFGANIGISAAYFLSRNPAAYVYCYEPLPENVAKLRRNLAPFAGRYNVQEVAIADRDGEISFRVERTGRYSGIDNQQGELRQFPCVNASRVLHEIVQARGGIDFLKIDVEGAEALFVPLLDEHTLSKTGVICIEGKEVLSSSAFRLSKTISGVLRYTQNIPR